MVYFILVAIFILSFTKGILELFAGMPEQIPQLIIEALIVLLYAYSFINVLRTKKVLGVGIYINSLLLVVIFISFLVTNVNKIQLILFMRQLLIYYMFFYALYNINLEKATADKVLKLLKGLFIIQVIGAFVKVGTIGTLEKIVGTMTVAEGSAATIMPLLAISYLIAHYLEFKNIKAVIMVFLFVAIGLISNKIGILFYVMFFFVFHSYLYTYKQSKVFINVLFIRKMFMVAGILSVIFVAFVSLNPRTNPEHQVGGSIDIQYLENYIDDYQHLKQKGEEARVDGDGRFDAPAVAMSRLSDGGFIHVLFGFGPGEIIKSAYTPYHNPLLEKYNIGYGGRIGLVWTMMQLGIIGVIVLVLFHIILFQKLWRVYFSSTNRSKEFSVLTLAAIGFTVLYFIDYFTYSKKMIQTTGIALTYYFVIYYVLYYSKKDRENL